MKNHLKILTILFCSTLYLKSFTQNVFPDSGFVGIGTTTPDALLQVNGDIMIGAKTLGSGPAEVSNLVFGSEAMESNITGFNNTSIGQQTLRENLSGSYNTALGANALRNNETGEKNTATGYSAMNANLSGSGNTANGYHALSGNLSGNDNVALGYDAMQNSYAGDENVSIGAFNMQNSTKGDFNTSVGAYAMEGNAVGKYNTALGYDAEVSLGNLINSTVIGNGAIVDAKNKVRIGNASVLSNGGQVEWTAYSDARIKNNVNENVPGLEFINLLKPVTYHFDVDKQNTLMGVRVGEQVEGMYDIEKMQWTGFIAQDVEAAAKKINYDFSGVDKSGEIMGLRYSSFVVPMVKAIQELSEKNEELRMENEEFENRISKLEKYISKQGIVLTDDLHNAASKTSITLQNANSEASLSQNIPNPFTGKTTIQYYVPETAQAAQIKFVNANGASVFIADVKLGNGVLEIDATQLSAGTYSYTLIVDGKVIDTKLMVIQR